MICLLCVRASFGEMCCLGSRNSCAKTLMLLSPKPCSRHTENAVFADTRPYQLHASADFAPSSHNHSVSAAPLSFKEKSIEIVVE